MKVKEVKVEDKHSKIISLIISFYECLKLVLNANRMYCRFNSIHFHLKWENHLSITEIFLQHRTHKLGEVRGTFIGVYRTIRICRQVGNKSASRHR